MEPSSLGLVIKLFKLSLVKFGRALFWKIHFFPEIVFEFGWFFLACVLRLLLRDILEAKTHNLVEKLLESSPAQEDSHES